MLPAAVVSHFPLRVDDGALTNFDDAVARLESRTSCRPNELDVGPLVAMVVDVVSNLAELQYQFRSPGGCFPARIARR